MENTPGLSRHLAGWRSANAASVCRESSAKAAAAPDGCDAIISSVTNRSLYLMAPERPLPAQPKLKVSQDLRGLAAKGREGAGEAERNRDQERGRGGAECRARHPDEGKIHHPRHHEVGGGRAGRYGEHHRSQADEEIFERIGGGEPR